MTCERNRTCGCYNPNAGLIRAVSKFLKNYLWYARREEAFRPPLQKTIVKNPTTLTPLKDLPSSLHHRTVNYLLNGNRLHIILGYLVKVKHLSQREKEIRQIIWHHLFCGSSQQPKWEIESADSEVIWEADVESRMEGKYKERWRSSKCLMRVPQGVTQRLVNMAARLLVATDSVGFRKHDCELLEKGLQKLIIDRNDFSCQGQSSEKTSEVKPSKWCKPKSKMPSCCYPTCLLTQMKSSQDRQPIPSKKKRRYRIRQRKKLLQKTPLTDRSIQTEAELWDIQKDLGNRKTDHGTRSTLPDFVPRPSSAFFKRTPIDNYTTTLVSTDSLEQIYEYDDDDFVDDDDDQFITVINGCSDEGTKSKKSNIDDSSHSKVVVDDLAKSGQSSGYCSIANISIHTSFEEDEEDEEEDKSNVSASTSAAPSNNNGDTDVENDKSRPCRVMQEVKTGSHHRKYSTEENSDRAIPENSAISAKADLSVSSKNQKRSFSDETNSHDAHKELLSDQSRHPGTDIQSSESIKNDLDDIDSSHAQFVQNDLLDVDKLTTSPESTVFKESIEIKSSDESGNASGKVSEERDGESGDKSHKSSVEKDSQKGSKNVSRKTSEEGNTQDEKELQDLLSSSVRNSTLESTTVKDSTEMKSSEDSGSAPSKTSQYLLEEDDLQDRDHTKTSVIISSPRKRLKQSNAKILGKNLAETSKESLVVPNKKREHFATKGKQSNLRAKKTHKKERSTSTTFTSSEDDLPQSSPSENRTSPDDLSDEENDSSTASITRPSSEESSLKETDGADVSDSEHTSSYLTEDDDESGEDETDDDKRFISPKLERSPEDTQKPNNTMFIKDFDLQESSDNMDGDSSEETEETSSEETSDTASSDLSEVSQDSDGSINTPKEAHISNSNVHAAAKNGDLSTVKALVKRDGKIIETVDEKGWTPLLVAASYGHPSIVQKTQTLLAFANRPDWAVLFLADVGSDLTALDPSGYAAVHLAAMGGYYEVIQVLLGLNIDVDLPTTSEGFTALHLAALNNHVPCCKVLLGCGASMEAEDRIGRTVVEMLDEHSSSEVRKLLENMQDNLSRFHNLVQVLADASRPSKCPSESLPPNVLELLVDLAAEDEQSE